VRSGQSKPSPSNSKSGKQRAVGSKQWAEKYSRKKMQKLIKPLKQINIYLKLKAPSFLIIKK
jgi:hypothetical protein